MGFSINYLKITAPKEVVEKNGKIYKNLLTVKDFENNNLEEKRTFCFNDGKNRDLMDSFFCKNVNIQAIVGINGCGKSSLLDLLYVTINNFCFLVQRGLKTPGANPLFYVPDIYVDIHYSITNSKKHNGNYFLSCKNDVIKFTTPNAIYDLSLFQDDFCSSFSFVSEIAENFFYTIVSNYSMQSFVSSNYNRLVYEYDYDNKCLNKKQIERCWINSIFHKNDGYISSIVLNPCREEGIINCSKEQNLSKERLTSLLIFSKQIKEENKTHIEFFEPFSLNSISMRLKKDFLKNKLKNLILRWFSLYSEITTSFDHLFPDNRSVTTLLNKSLVKLIGMKFHFPYSRQPIKKIAEMYLLLKIIDIVYKYADYFSYRSTIFLKIDGAKIKIYYDKKTIHELIDTIYNDNSHKTKKIKRIVNFLYMSNSNINSLLTQKTILWSDYIFLLHNKYQNETTNPWTIGTKRYDHFLSWNLFKLSEKILFFSPVHIDYSLPPSIFDYDLFLNKKNSNDTIEYQDISSGEMQLLQTLSVHAYHIENLLSVRPIGVNQQTYPKYRCVNLVFDEVEICFHPEYQRNFVKNLLSLIKAMKENNHPNSGGLFINVFIVTHSPFVLSDIPLNNVLFLDNGAQTKKTLKTFAGNIGEMVYDSFFLKSSIGAFAETKIKEIIKDFHTLTPSNDVLIKKKIACIGDPILKSLIENTGKYVRD